MGEKSVKNRIIIVFSALGVCGYIGGSILGEAWGLAGQLIGGAAGVIFGVWVYDIISGPHVPNPHRDYYIAPVEEEDEEESSWLDEQIKRERKEHEYDLYDDDYR